MECMCTNYSKRQFPNPVILYDNVNPKVRSVLMVMHRLNIRIPLRFIDTLAGEHMTDEYKRINPASTVPTLIDNDLVLFTSPAILVHLASNYNGRNLYPCDFEKQMRIMNMLFFDLSVLYRRHGAYMAALIRSEDKEKIDDFYGPRILDSYQVLEKILSGSNYMASDQISLADYGIMGTMTGLNLILPLKNYSVEFPRLLHWFICMKKLPEYSKEVITGIEKERMFIENLSKNMINSNESIGEYSIISQDLSTINESIGKKKKNSTQIATNFRDSSEQNKKNKLVQKNQFEEFLNSSSEDRQISELQSHGIDFYDATKIEKTKSSNNILSSVNKLCNYSKQPETFFVKVSSCKCSRNCSSRNNVEKSYSLIGESSVSENSYSNIKISPVTTSIKKFSKDSLITSSNLKACIDSKTDSLHKKKVLSSGDLSKTDRTLTSNGLQNTKNMPYYGTMFDGVLDEESESECIKPAQSTVKISGQFLGTDVVHKSLKQDPERNKCRCTKKEHAHSVTVSKNFLDGNKTKDHDALFSGNTASSSKSDEFEIIEKSKNNSKTLNLKSNCGTCSRCKCKIPNCTASYVQRSDVDVFHNYNTLHYSNKDFNSYESFQKSHETIRDKKKCNKTCHLCNGSCCLSKQENESRTVAINKFNEKSNSNFSDFKTCLNSFDFTHRDQPSQSNCSKECTTDEMVCFRKPVIREKKGCAFICKENNCRDKQNCHFEGNKVKNTIKKVTSDQNNHKLISQQKLSSNINAMDGSYLDCICSSIGCLRRTKNKQEILQEEMKICKGEANVDSACPGCKWFFEIMLQHFEKYGNLCAFHKNLSTYSNDHSNEQCCTSINSILGPLENIKK